MDSIEIESEYDAIEVVTQPTSANLLFDSVEKEFHRFHSWSDSRDAYHTRLHSETTVTVRKYLHPTNRYYFVQSTGFKQNE